MVFQKYSKIFLLLLMVGILSTGSLQLGFSDLARAESDKIKVLYHVDSKDIETVTYAMALINKHIEAEGGPDKIDVVVVVHGPALELFKADTIDPTLKTKLKSAIDKGTQAEMCQVSMKLYGTPLEKLVAGFVQPSILWR